MRERHEVFFWATAEQLMHLKKAVRERHEAFFWVTAEQLMHLLGGWSRDGEFLRPVLKGVPEGAAVRAVHFDWHRNAFGILLSHPSFPMVHDGDEIPWCGRLEVELQEMSPAADAPAVAPESPRRG